MLNAVGGYVYMSLIEEVITIIQNIKYKKKYLKKQVIFVSQMCVFP